MSTQTKNISSTHGFKTIMEPKNFLLQSFNVLEIKDPTDIADQLKKCAIADIPAGDINEQTALQQFSGIYKEQTTEQSVKEELSVSVGIKGKYGVYSGSVQVDYTDEESLSTTSFNSSYYATLKCGTIYYNKGNEEIRSILNPKMLADLDAIKNLKDAEAFTNTWNTHLVKRVNLGGSLFVGVESSTKTIEEKTSLSVKVKAEYNAVSSISTAADVINKIAKNESIKNVKQTIATMGGNSVMASAINPLDPKTFSAWAATCEKDSIYTIADSIEIYTLTKGDARNILEKYINLILLKQSLTHPTLFIEEKYIKAFEQNQIAVSVPTNDYKIIGGGASVTLDSSNFLLGSFPTLDNTGNIHSWCATSHDVSIQASSSDIISAYAFAIYDPGDLLNVKVVTAKGTNIGIGKDEATATLPNEWTLTCGGSRSEENNNSNFKFLMGSYPMDKYNWRAVNHDYQIGSSNVELTSYIIGIKSNEPLLKIDSGFQKGSESKGQHGNSISKVIDCVCGGGVLVELLSGDGDLVQMTYPSNPKTWAEANKDHAGAISQAKSWAYAVFLKASITI